ncbi:MAG: L-threonylcarbamoyladenylate synthase [Planctomycetota bacterium]|nr:L-threonylcarbamoyladenylate synthase [Planctomycetota bacterium]MDW8372981.1 L-threonylcarbamoyladenylate synthase [Planctomycetota bacterium]
MSRPRQADDNAIAEAVAALARGELVAMPTETVYGLAADATNERAVLAVFAAKGRPRFDPLIVHCSDLAMVQQVAQVSPRAERLAAAFWPGPLTLVLPRRPLIPDVVTAGLDTVAVRIPAHPVAQALIRACGRPLAAPSANRFGAVSPTSAAHVAEQLASSLALILDGGPCAVGIESTVLVPDPQPLILRPGGVTRARIATVLGEPVRLAARQQRLDSLRLASPGLLSKHYAPRAPLVLRAPDEPWPDDAAALAFSSATAPAAGVFAVLSERGDLAEAAATLFAKLRALDALAPSRIVAELVPDEGLGEAINDRLRRAAGLG